MIKPLVSIVVTTYNESKNIDVVLNSCKKQSYPSIEIIVVDSKRTTDNTASIARRFNYQVYVFGNERSVQRNYGVSKSKGEYVLILDADMKLSPTVVSDCIKSGYPTLIIPEKSYGESYWAWCKALERNCYIGDPQIEAPRFFKNISFLKNLGASICGSPI